MAKYQLEVGARTVEDALSAWRGGADRVELYVSPTEGALTPSMGLVQAAVAAKKAAQSDLGLFVMLRPRSGDFLYSDADFDTLLRDTENLYAAGADGFMSGIVTPDGKLDVKRMKEVMKRCPGKPFTLHRGFESTRDQFRTLEECVDLGIDYILTGGLVPNGGLDTARLSALIEKAAGRIKIVVALGSGFTVDLLGPIIEQSGAVEYHIVNGYRQRLSRMQWVPGCESLDDDHLRKKLGTVDYLEESAVRELRDIFNKYE
ncbi:MAG: copper homeostasis protein CutC [Lentisphaerae bacterium]|nr:copper homeostasis protein CutC [Lentisphaerota bacterium]